MDELIAQLSENPEGVSDLSRDQLTEAADALRARGKELVALVRDGSSDDTDADLAAIKEAKALLESVSERIAEFEASDAETAEAVAELETAFDTDELEASEEEETEKEEPEIEGELEIEIDPPADTPKVEDNELIEAEKVPVAASSRPSIGMLAKRTPRHDPETGLVASAGSAVPADFGGRFDNPLSMAEAALKVHGSYGKTARVDAQATIASFDTGSLYKYTVGGDKAANGAALESMLADLTKGETALVASGGICAPTQPTYDFFSISERAGLLQLPSFNASRGSVSFPVSTSYATIRANVNWANAVGQEHTNADDEAGTSKNVFAVECPTDTTCTVAAYPIILQFGNFVDRFYPEAVADAMSESMTFHAHYMNETHINAIVAASTAQAIGDTGGGGLVNVANTVGFQAAKYRDNYRMSPDATLDLIVPAWVRDALVADLVARNATTSFENARARVAAVFASLNLNVQWVQDYQSIGDNDDDGFPPSADMVLHAPGTFVRLDGGTLDLGVVRDSTLNATNDFQIFTETFETVCEVGHDSWLLDGVIVCPRGSAAADVTLDCSPGFGS